MSGLPNRSDDAINGVDVREQGSALRVATNTPHLVSLGTGRLSTAVTLHPIKQGRVTIGSDPTCDIYVVGTGVANVHCRVENSHGVVTLYPISGTTLLDGLPADKPTRLSQGSMLTIGRSNYLRFNHPEEAKLMKSVLPSGHVSMAPIQFQPNEHCVPTGYMNHNADPINQCYQSTNMQKIYKDNSLTQLDHELDMTLKEMSRKKPPVAPRKPYKDLDTSDSNSDQETRPKLGSIMAKVSKFEYYAKQQKNVGRSQFYTSNEVEISPKVFSANSLTVNTPAKDVLGNRNLPNYISKRQDQKMIVLNENNLDPKNCSYANVAIRHNNKTKIDDIVRNFDDTTRNDTKLPKKVNNDQQCRPDNIYGKINVDRKDKNDCKESKNNLDCKNDSKNLNVDIGEYGRICGVGKVTCLSSPSYERNPQYSPVYGNCYDRGHDAESMRIKAYQDRIKEEEQKEAETARLEEILNMCAEYERQIASGIPITPTEKRPHNKIITNGSLPRSVTLNNPNFIQTSEGYYKFETSHSRSSPMSQSLPIQRNLSSYENFESPQSPKSESLTPEVSITDNNYENVGRMDEIGIPVFDEVSRNVDLSSPLMIRKLQNQSSPIGSPYENVYFKNNVGFKPKSPNTQSPRTRIKTTFAHKNLPSPQYFIFPTPPCDNNRKDPFSNDFKKDMVTDASLNVPINNTKEPNCGGIEKQLSLEEEIPMIDDADLTNDIEFRYSKVIDKNDESMQDTSENAKSENDIDYKQTNNIDRLDSRDVIDNNEPEMSLTKNKSFDDVKKELMADIPELEEFEKELKQNKREKILRNITEDIKKMDLEELSLSSTILDETVDELKSKYETLKEERRKLVTQIHEIKCKMTEIRSQEDDILRELEMEKALIKGEYDSEIAILNIEQKKKAELVDRAKKIEEEIRQLKEKQESRQNEMKDRVEIATLKVERIEKDLKGHKATLEELQNAQDILDNETKIFEDLEFQHLEEESELLANREDLQNEIMLLSKKIEAQKTRILTLKSEANNNLTSALEETKVLHAEYVKLLNQVEHLTGKVQIIEKELKPVVAKLNDIERTQSPDSAFYTDQTRAKSGEFGYSPQSSDSDDIDVTKISNFEDHTKLLKDKFNTIDQMSQSMIVDIERRVTTDLDDPIEVDSSPSKSSSSSKEKKGFWERNFDSLKRRSKDKKKTEKIDIMSQSLNENIFYNDNIEVDVSLDKFNSLRNSKKKDKKENGPVKSNSSSKIPTFAALGKIIKKDSLKRKEMNAQKEKEKETIKPIQNEEAIEQNNVKIRYVKNFKPIIVENKYVKSKSLSPDKISNEPIKEEEDQETGNIDSVFKKSDKNAKILHRKSCGDEPNVRTDFHKMTDSGKIPSQDDIDRISKVTMDAPILSSDTDVNSLGKRTLDSLMEIERKRMEMLEEKGCQMIENQREKISELKRRVQDETKKLWDQRNKEKKADSQLSNNLSNVSHNLSNVSSEFDSEDRFGSGLEDVSFEDPFNLTNSTIYEESSGLVSSSIEELQVRNSRTESTEDDKRSDDSRPLSHASDFSRENILSVSGGPRRSRRGVSEWQRPLTRYLPVDRDDFDLRRHVESAGHQIELCPYVTLSSASCRGYLHKLGAKFHTWSKRWFVFDRESKTFVYYWDKSEKKPRGGAYFQVIEEVYLDHGNTSKSPNPQTTFIVKTRQRRYYLMAPSGEAARIWIDVIFTGAQGYTEYLE
ncbi:pleckstrin homology-like domain family B member 2 [Bicyclus anynana]|uniref:Pleckstrin homology-like domain family B member 2 n=1 Tax=Bicyclus anynana TaxID=110368 RepID=A0ABM3LVW2_BICAN|nr:pleckstrin homology-like domain family B member 2 [Bicyclus anynana]